MTIGRGGHSAGVAWTLQKRREQKKKLRYSSVTPSETIEYHNDIAKEEGGEDLVEYYPLPGWIKKLSVIAAIMGLLYGTANGPVFPTGVVCGIIGLICFPIAYKLMSAILRNILIIIVFAGTVFAFIAGIMYIANP